LDYIDFTRTGLKDQISHLSILLLGIVNYGILPPQKLVLQTLPYSRLSEVGDRPLEELLQYCTEDQNAVEPAEYCTEDQDAIEPAQGLLQYCTKDQDTIEQAQGTVPDCPPEDTDQLSSPLAIMDSGTPSDSAMDFSEYVDFSTPNVLWAGDCEYHLNTAAIEAKNSMIVNSTKECYLSQASHLDNEFLLSPTVIYQGILNKFEVLIG
jgi:hypothetical protein